MCLHCKTNNVNLTKHMSYDAYALIGVSHHFSGNERLTVGKSLVMLGDLSLDVVERKIFAFLGVLLVRNNE